MLRELNENEMEMVSGGSIQNPDQGSWDDPSLSPAWEQYITQLDKRSQFELGGSDGTVAVDTGGDAQGNSTGILFNVSNPSGIGTQHPNACDIASATGWSLGAVGLVVAGIALTPVSAGTSLGLTAAGLALTAGGVGLGAAGAACSGLTGR